MKRYKLELHEHEMSADKKPSKKTKYYKKRERQSGKKDIKKGLKGE